jgi:microsomal dipeptidase-like Zn-dependent dipeptidase
MTVDIHCHPCLKTYLFGHDFSERHNAGSEFDPFGMHCDLPGLRDGVVNAILASHYLPEIGLLRHCAPLASAAGLLKLMCVDLVDKMESDSAPDAPFHRMIGMIDAFDEAVAASRERGFDATAPRCFAELTTAHDRGAIAILHSIEGGHVLGRSLGDAERYIGHLHAFAERGVCLMTIGHFFENDLVAPVEGMPPGVKSALACNPPPPSKEGLSPIGERIVEEMLEIGMIVDLTHSTPSARARIFGINESRGPAIRPLVFSHAGVRAVFRDPAHPGFELMNPSDEEILRIARCNGAIGIIFDNYWLAGAEEQDLPLLPDLSPEPGLSYVLDTVAHIRRLTGSFANIAIGSDLDGFTDPPDDLKDGSAFPLLWDALSRFKVDGQSLSDIDVEGVMGENALRILREGWR